MPVVNTRVLKRVEYLEREIPPIGCCGPLALLKHLAQAVLGMDTMERAKATGSCCVSALEGLFTGPEILRNKVHTGWVWQILLRKNQGNIIIQKIHHKSTLQISGPNLFPFSQK